jgi:hypothetical protein
LFGAQYLAEDTLSQDPFADGCNSALPWIERQHVPKAIQVVERLGGKGRVKSFHGLVRLCG